MDTTETERCRLHLAPNAGKCADFHVKRRKFLEGNSPDLVLSMNDSPDPTLKPAL